MSFNGQLATAKIDLQMGVPSTVPLPTGQLFHLRATPMISFPL